MKRLFLLLTIFTLLFAALHAEVKYSKRYNKVTKSWNSYPEVTIHSIQYNPLDSLLKADTLQTTISSRWTLQIADRVETTTKSDDTVTVTGLVVIPPKMIGYTAAGFTMVLYDTGVGNAPWSGITVRCNSPTDTLQNIADGFLTIERGDIIKITGVLAEFPLNSMNSLTQFQPIAGISIDILNPLEKASVPPPIILGDSASKFYTGPYVTTGPYHVNYSTGEEYESMIVEFRHLTTGVYFNVGGRSMFEMVDAFGNSLSSHDASRWFTVTGLWRDTASTWTLPPNYSVIDTLRGLVLQISGGGASHGYFVAPMYQVNPSFGVSDAQFGIAKPTVFNHQRLPIIIHDEESFEIRAQVMQTVGGVAIDSVFCFLSINDGPFVKHLMEEGVDTGSTYGVSFDGSTSGLGAGMLVKYYIEVFDVIGQSSKLAYQKSATESGTDTSVAFFNFRVLGLGAEPKISDVQYTPYPSVGVSSYVGATVTLRGIVTVDSSDMALTAHNNYHPNAYFIQSGTSPWSGIWIAAGSGDTTLSKIRRGDSIAVTAKVSEFNTITELFPVINTATVISSGNAVPAPIDLPTSALTSGSAIAEQYEGMLVRLTNLQVAELAPYFSDPKIYSVNDGSGDVYVGSFDGKNTFTNAGGDSTLGKTSILYLATPIDTLVGIAHYNGSANRWAICPRQDNDFVAGYHITYDNGWNLISIGREQTPAATGYSFEKLFPGALSNAFKFAGSYVSDTAIWPGTGYWLKVAGGSFFRQLGAPIANVSIPGTAGWNLVGMVGDSITDASVTVDPPTMTLGNFFGYKNGYTVATMLQPTRGYWVKTSEAGTLGMATTAMAKSGRGYADLKAYNTITIENKNGASQTLYFGSDPEGRINLSAYEMPPSAPNTSMDVRFTSGRVLETYSANVAEGKKFGIAVRNFEGAVKISWNIQPSETKGFTLTDGKGNPVVSMTGSGSFAMNKVPSSLGIAVVNGAEKPKEFALSQNFPNPFNPTTNFSVSLPMTEHLEVGVYNVLGQKVATLANDVREAGTYSITWNSTTDAGMSASSGVYFLKMTAGNFTSVRKIMLMK